MTNQELQLLNRILVNADIKAYEIELYSNICKTINETFIKKEEPKDK